MCLNNFNLIQVDRVENYFMVEIKKENYDETGEDCDVVTDLEPKKDPLEIKEEYKTIDDCNMMIDFEALKNPPKKE